jgi:peroxiredoxin
MTDTRTTIDPSLLNDMTTNTGEALNEIADQQPVLLIFLRHFGCTFCREALADISKKRESLERAGTRIIFVHMTDYDVADRYFLRYHLDGAVHVSDPQSHYYAAFGLVKGSINQLFGLQSWIRGFSAGVVSGHGAGPQLGDGFQMPGVFVIHKGQIKESFIHNLSSDRPDYQGLVNCCD